MTRFEREEAKATRVALSRAELMIAVLTVHKRTAKHQSILASAWFVPDTSRRRPASTRVETSSLVSQYNLISLLISLSYAMKL